MLARVRFLIHTTLHRGEGRDRLTVKPFERFRGKPFKRLEGLLCVDMFASLKRGENEKFYEGRSTTSG